MLPAGGDSAAASLASARGPSTPRPPTPRAHATPVSPEANVDQLQGGKRERTGGFEGRIVRRPRGVRIAVTLVAAGACALPLAAAQATPSFPLTRVAQDRIVDGAGLHHSAQQALVATAAGSKTLVATYQVGRI